MPTGRGVLDGGSLLAPMSTGAISKIELKTGRIIQTMDAVLPVSGWGHLESSFGDDIFYSAPDVLLRISRSKPATTPQNPLEIATALAASQKWVQALEVLESVPDSSPLFAEAESLRFRCCRELAIRDPQAHLQSLREAARTPKQHLTAEVLEVQWLQQQGKSSDAVTALVRLLKNRSTLYSSIVATHLSATEKASGVRMTVSSPLLTWICRNLSELLESVPGPENIVDQLADVPVTAVMRIDHASVRPILQDNIQDGSFSETTFRVLRKSIDLARNDDGTYSDLKPESRSIPASAEAMHRTG